MVIGPSLFVKNQSSVVSMRFDLKREGFNKIQIKIDFCSHSSQRTDGLNWLRDKQLKRKIIDNPSSLFFTHL